MSEMSKQITDSYRVLSDVGIKVQHHELKIGNLNDQHRVLSREISKIKEAK
jgi:hypothetical protein